MHSLLFTVGILAVTARASYDSEPFDNFVTFGDSYTDNGRLSYYFAHGGQPPPAGTLQPSTNVTASGGLAWGQVVAQSTGAAYFDYAVSGATCSNDIVSRYLAGINRTFPAVLEDELPSFVADVQFQTLYANRTADNTVYALWIGTNDLGYGALLTDSQAPGVCESLSQGETSTWPETDLIQTNITSYIDCVWSVFDTIYATGGRRFVLLNTAPLQLAPLYASQSVGGVGDNQFWPNKTAYNETEYQYKILEYTQLVDRLFDYGVPFEVLVKGRWPNATFDIFDVNSLITDIHDNPSAYLDAPANVTGWYHNCNTEGSDCVDATNPLDTFLWYDTLHPSARTDEIIAREFIGVVAGNSSYGTRYG